MSRPDNIFEFEQWGLTWYGCTKHIGAPPQTEPRCPECAIEPLKTAMLILFLIFGMLLPAGAVFLKMIGVLN